VIDPLIRRFDLCNRSLDHSPGGWDYTAEARSLGAKGRVRHSLFSAFRQTNSAGAFDDFLFPGITVNLR
jgi:hypothetical protein